MNLANLRHADQVAAILTATDEAIISAHASVIGRRSRGVPKSSAERCQCGTNTLKRATARGFACCRERGLDPR